MTSNQQPPSSAVSNDDAPLPPGESTRAVGGSRTPGGSSYGDFTPNRGDTIYVESSGTSDAASANGDTDSRTRDQKESGTS